MLRNARVLENRHRLILNVRWGAVIANENL